MLYYSIVYVIVIIIIINMFVSGCLKSCLLASASISRRRDTWKAISGATMTANLTRKKELRRRALVFTRVSCCE